VKEWEISALVLVLAMVPLGVVCVQAAAVDGLVALQVAGTTAALVLLLLAESMQRQPFADLALVLGLTSFVGSLAFAYFLERSR
jgi:multisubunit Na+/H+ antiporter MnhF subunit